MSLPELINFIALIVYFLIIFVIAFMLPPSKDKEEFLAGNRSINPIKMAFSIASTWIWAPALFVSAEKAYIDGLVGLFWFLVPNVLCLIAFIPFAIRIRRKLPYGYTLSEFMGKVYSNRVKNIYLFALSSLSLLSTVVQLIAGGRVISIMTGLPFWATSMMLGLFILAYSWRSGINASVKTDFYQLIFILGGLIVFVPWMVKEVSFGSIIAGITGIKGDSINLFSQHGWKVFVTFGIPTTIGLLSGPFGDQNFWQRAFSVREKDIAKSYVLGAIIFAMCPLLMSMFGFMAAGLGYQANDTSMVNLELIGQYLPSWVSIIFMFMLLSGLASTIDSNLAAVSSMVNDIKDEPKLRDYRLGMVIVTVAAILMANIPTTIIDFFLIYGSFRSSTLLTTILTLLDVKLEEKGVFYGVLSSLLIGFPMFVTGKIIGSTGLAIAGSLTTVLLSGIVSLVYSKVKSHVKTKAVNG